MKTNEKKLVRAEEGPDYTVIYYDENGNKIIRYRKKNPDDQPSSRSWRNYNPGNLKPGPHA